MATMDQIWEKVCDLFKMRDYRILFIILLSFIILSHFGFKIGKEAYFYTLSTISQTLAALIGIIAIFVIFKLEMLKTKRSDSFKRLEILFRSDTGKSAVQNRNQEPYKEICSVIDQFYIDFTINDKVLNELLRTIENLDSGVTHLNAMKGFIESSENIIGNVSKIDEHIKNIPQKFGGLVIVALSTIILSIVALPLGWFIAPIGILSNLSILKLPFVVFIVYLTILSIFQTKQFLDYVINSKY